MNAYLKVSHSLRCLSLKLISNDLAATLETPHIAGAELASTKVIPAAGTIATAITSEAMVQEESEEVDIAVPRSKVRLSDSV
jgi:hypothetical protein